LSAKVNKKIQDHKENLAKKESRSIICHQRA